MQPNTPSPREPAPGTAMTPCTHDQLAEMTEHIFGYAVTLGALLPQEYSVSTYYRRIVVSRDVPDQLVAETLISAMYDITRAHHPDLPQVARPALLPTTVAVLDRDVP